MDKKRGGRREPQGVNERDKGKQGDKGERRGRGHEGNDVEKNLW